MPRAMSSAIRTRRRSSSTKLGVLHARRFIPKAFLAEVIQWQGTHWQRARLCRSLKREP